MKPPARNPRPHCRERPRPPSAACPLAALLVLQGGVALLWLQPGASLAGPRTLQVAPLISRSPGGPCPANVTLLETLQPYREGSYGPICACASIPARCG